MIDLQHPLAVLGARLAWAQIEAELAPMWQRQRREGVVQQSVMADLFDISCRTDQHRSARAVQLSRETSISQGLYVHTTVYRLCDNQAASPYAVVVTAAS